VLTGAARIKGPDQKEFADKILDVVKNWNP